eukprot:gene8048-1282_t
MAAAFRGIALKSVVPRAMVRGIAPLAPCMRPAGMRSVASKALVEAFTTENKGASDSTDFRIMYKAGEKSISPWHEIPLYAEDGNLHFVCEIPKETSAKMEVATDECYNPIKQDIKKGKLRFYPYNINWNYGMLPQTWEDPATAHPELKVSGDNDPVDVVEIGSAAGVMGGVYKSLTGRSLPSLPPTPRPTWSTTSLMSREITKITEWFRDYKMPDGKPANMFGYDNECKGKAFTMDVIKETHEAYVNLKSGARKNTEELSLM